jgi:hypothetical protein
VRTSVAKRGRRVKRAGRLRPLAAAPDIDQLVRQGVAIVLATRDAQLRPAVARGWGPLLQADATTLTLCIEAPEGTPTRANLAEGAPAAINITLPSTYSSIQVKGRVAAVRALDDGDRERIARHGNAFVLDTSTLGLAERIARALQDTDYVTVDVALAERFDQTPGPGAGARL